MKREGGGPGKMKKGRSTLLAHLDPSSDQSEGESFWGKKGKQRPGKEAKKRIKRDLRGQQKKTSKEKRSGTDIKLPDDCLENRLFGMTLGLTKRTTSSWTGVKENLIKKANGHRKRETHSVENCGALPLIGGAQPPCS